MQESTEKSILLRAVKMWYSSTRSHVGKQSCAQGHYYAVRLHRKTSLCRYCTTKGGNRREVSFALRDIEVNRDLIVIAGVGGVVFDVFLGDHVHLQEGAEDVGVVVQNHLLKRHRHLAPPGGVEFPGQLLDQRRDLRIVISAKIVAHARNAGGGEEILGVAGGSCYQRGSVNIPAAHVRQKLPAVCGAVDVHVNADLFEGRLGGLCLLYTSDAADD